MKSLWFGLLLTLTAHVSAQNLTQAFSDVKLITEDYPPLNYLDQGQLTGASVEILRLVYRQLALPAPKVEVMPWARGYHLAQSDYPYLLFTMSRTAAREDLFQWAGHTHASQTFLVTFTGSGIDQYDPTTVHDDRIVAIKSDVTELALKELNYPADKIDLVDSNATLFHMLKNQRAPLYSVADSALLTLSKQADYNDYGVVILATTRKSRGYFAFSKAVNPMVVSAFQAALEQVRDEQRVILKKYGLNY